MPIALERSDERPRFVHGGMAFIPIYNLPDDRTCSSSSSSSIGRNSDDSPAVSDGDGEEIQSAFKAGGALDNLEGLEEVLPIKRGISNFYSGKSKSFMSLADAASCSSLKDMVKPENAVTRKRKNLLAHSNFFDKNWNHFPRNYSGALYRIPINSRSSVALGATSSCSESNNSSESLNSNPSSPRFSLPPLPPQSRKYSNESSLSPPEQKFSAWRSFSLSDLQGAAAATPSLMGIKE